jgi:hypothetical protein
MHLLGSRPLLEDIMFGFTEAISLLFALGGVGVDANPKAPTADAVLEHQVEDADIVVHFDAAAVIPRNYKVLTGLSTDASVQASPELRDMVRKLTGEIEGARGMAKGMLGVDPTTDISSLTVFLKLKPAGEPDGVVVVRGKFPPDLVKKVAGMTGGKVESIDGRDAVAIDGETLLGTTKSGALLLGSVALARPRLASAWKAPARSRTAPVARLAQVLDTRPFLATYVRPSAEMLKEVSTTDKNLVTDLVRGLEVATFALHHDGMSWTWSDKTDAGARRAKLSSEGLVELIRAMHIAPRGLAKIAAASIDSYAGQSKEIDLLIKRKDDLLALVGDFTGDGKFRAAVTQTGKLVSVRLSGKKVSDVVPLAFVAPAIAAGAYFQAKDESTAPVVKPLPPASTKPATKPAPRPATPAKKPATRPQPRP